MEAIRDKLTQLIQDEHPDTPYSDEQLAQLMAQDGVFLTDDMVERLREEMNIPDSDHRIFYDPQHDLEDDCDDDHCDCDHEHCDCDHEHCDCDHDHEHCGCEHDHCDCGHHH